MNRVNPCAEFASLSDVQLLEIMLTNEKAHSCIYLKHKSYCISFMRSKGSSESDALDIYQDATIVLYEKIQSAGFILSCSLQTYLNSICFNQLLCRNTSSYNKKIELKDEIDENVQDWFVENDELINEKINIVLSALNNLKSNGDKCYERLNLFYYHKLKNEEIAIRLGLKDATTVKNLINRCRVKLKEIIGIK